MSPSLRPHATLAAFAERTTTEPVASKRAQTEARLHGQLEQHVYVPELAWHAWLPVVDSASRYLAEHPELDVPREATENPKYAHTLTTRKKAARSCALRWTRTFAPQELHP